MADLFDDVLGENDPFSTTEVNFEGVVAANADSFKPLPSGFYLIEFNPTPDNPEAPNTTDTRLGISKSGNPQIICVFTTVDNAAGDESLNGRPLFYYYSPNVGKTDKGRKWFAGVFKALLMHGCGIDEDALSKPRTLRELYEKAIMPAANKRARVVVRVISDEDSTSVMGFSPADDWESNADIDDDDETLF